jgi:hypothetical protein
MAQTALTKAIEYVENKIKEAHDTIKSGVDERAKTILRYDIATLNKVVLHLYSLLPYERETIEAAYIKGDNDCWENEFASGAEFTDKQDYFTKTYNQNEA